jgi:hypothetical protein
MLTEWLLSFLDFNITRLGGNSLSLNGCQIVTGGRSVAETTGTQTKRISTLLKGARTMPAHLRSAILSSGGLRFAATTGYYRSNPSG